MNAALARRLEALQGQLVRLETVARNVYIGRLAADGLSGDPMVQTSENVYACIDRRNVLYVHQL